MFCSTMWYHIKQHKLNLLQLLRSRMAQLRSLDRVLDISRRYGCWLFNLVPHAIYVEPLPFGFVRDARV